MSSVDPTHRRYQGESGRAYHEGKRALPPSVLPWVQSSRAALFQPWIKPTDHVLEFGCGFGWNLAELVCASRTGCDLAESLRPSVESAGAQYITNLADASANRFDVVIAYHVLEHVRSPADILDLLHQRIRVGGHLLISVPYEKERRYRQYDPTEPNHHLYSWNVQTLAALLDILGWRIQSAALRPYGYDRRAALLAERFRLGERGFRIIRHLIRTLRPLQEVHVVAHRASPDAP